MIAASRASILLAFGITVGALHSAANAAERALPLVRARDASSSLALAKLLESHDQAEQLMLLDELDAGPESARAARTLATLLRAGQPDVVSDHALDALARLRARDAREVLVTFTRHRRPDARRRAYAALAAFQDPADSGVFEQGLRDSAAEVRAVAARTLGDLHAGATTPSLLRALAHGVNEAAPALGQVGDANSLDEFDKFLGRLPLPVMLAGYAHYLQRSDLGEQAKLRIVAALENVSGAAVKAFLNEQLAKPCVTCSPKLRRALESAASRVRAQPAEMHP
jgi:HEAT repeat protein